MHTLTKNALRSSPKKKDTPIYLKVNSLNGTSPALTCIATSENPLKLSMQPSLAGEMMKVST